MCSPADLSEDRLPELRVLRDLVVFVHSAVAPADVEIGIAVVVIPDLQLVVQELEVS